MPILATKLEQTDNITDNEFETEFYKINDTNCELPITPAFHEKHSYFIIVCDNEIDEQFVRNILELNKKHTSHKSTDDRLSNVLTVEHLQNVWKK